MTTPPLPPPLAAYPAAPAALPGQGVPAPPPASPPPPPWASWQPAPSAGPASLPQGVPIQRPPPVYSAAPAPSPVYTTAGVPPRPSFPDPPHARFAEPSAGRAEYPAQGATGLAPPRYAKLEFATYDGVEDPLNWLSQCEQFFRGQRTLASDRTWLASYHLRGAAQTWYYSLEQDDGGMPPWDRFRELCLLRFGPPIRGSRLAELGRLAFTTTVQDFADRFQALACHAPGMTGQQRAELFIGGLPDHIRADTVDVEEGEPTTGPVAAAPETAGPTDAAATAFVVSLHALAGIRHERTMLLPVTIQGEPLVALLDTGSTHNFLPAATMCRLALQPTGGDILRVTVANGDRLH
ncbi:uncharacterized protein LOC124664296 [Lolium rigidum]|uniref:uncharacterized protein LOC124664296 n=1 Tax=Lolium rigidum TaxID=89674 RepID=UPI001F5D0BC5|nr:uncharacterized protein LOC124664296 [Lolium rigidum]